MNLILLLAAIFISFAIFAWLLKVVKATISTAILIALIVLLLQLFFGIGPGQIWQQVSQIPETLWKIFSGGK